MVELEKKIMLNKKEYDCLTKHLQLRGATVQKQENYYYDDEDLSMERRGITCRIRQKGDLLIATVKTHSLCADQSEETSFPVAAISETFPQKEDLKYQGCLATNRMILHAREGVRICLDQNTYLDKEDYELEIEYIEGFEALINTMLAQIGDFLFSEGVISKASLFLARVGIGGNKSHRFFERQKQI